MLILGKSTDERRKKAWLEERKTRVTSTEIPVLFGCGYEGTSPHLLMAEKLGMTEPIVENERMRLGKAMEPVILGEYTHKTKRRAKLAPDWTLYHGPGVVSASIDAEDLDTGFDIEIKNTTMRIYEPQHIPKGWLLQTQTQMLCRGKTKEYLAVCVQGAEVRIFELEADPEVQEEILVAAWKFWEAVERNEPPPVTSPDDWPGVRALFPTPLVESVVLGIEEDEMAGEVRAWREQERQAKKGKEYAQARLAARIGNAEIGYLPNGDRVTWKADKNGKRSLRVGDGE